MEWEVELTRSGDFVNGDKREDRKEVRSLENSANGDVCPRIENPKEKLGLCEGVR